MKVYAVHLAVEPSPPLRRNQWRTACGRVVEMSGMPWHAPDCTLDLDNVSCATCRGSKAATVARIMQDASIAALVEEYTGLVIPFRRGRG